MGGYLDDMDQNPGWRDFFESGFYEQYWPEANDENGVKEHAASKFR